MRYSGIQPQYFPRLHYFARILNADVFYIRDDVQFVRKHKYPNGQMDSSYQSDTPVKHTSGIYSIHVPTKHEGLMPIAETHICYDQEWIEKHLSTLKFVYDHSDNFISLFPEIEAILNCRFKILSELNKATILWGILKLLEIKKVDPCEITLENVNSRLKKQNKFRLKEIKEASKSPLYGNLDKLTANEKIISFLKETGATEDYCGGTALAAYMDKELFAQAGIKITVQDWKCKPYPQQFMKNPGFIPNLSIIDLLMNTSISQATDIIWG